MEIKVDLAEGQSIVTEAILKSMDETMRAALIKDAIAHLLEKEKGPYGQYQVTPLQRAFRNALNSVAFDVVKDIVTNDPRVIAAVRDIAEKSIALTLQSDRVAQTFSNVFLNALERDG